jgi:hypothetical protein
MRESSYVVRECQVCRSEKLEPAAFAGYLPPVNQLRPLGAPLAEQPAYPAQVLHCQNCQLVQLGLVVDARILFPPEYPYTSRTTKILRDNFAELYTEATSLVPFDDKSLVVDVGSNDGTLLSNFVRGGHPVCGIEPTERAHEANAAGVRTEMAFFDAQSAERVVSQLGKARAVIATNVFAHIDDAQGVVKNIAGMLDDRGVFISESHYLHSLLETLQYDTIYHEHLRYYSLQSLAYLLQTGDFEVFHARRIPTHGGSVRVYAARKGAYPIQPSVATMLAAERALPLADQFREFRERMVRSKLELYRLLADQRGRGKRIVGIGAPSRASTLITYLGLDEGILDAVLEVPGSHKVGKYMPGTLIPVLEENYLFERKPDIALLLSWHIADELIPKLRAKGFAGQFIVPLPEPRLVD